MTDSIIIYKAIGLLLLVPLIFAIPLFFINKIIILFSDASANKKNKISFCIFLSISTCCFAGLLYHGFTLNSINIAICIILLSLTIHFIYQELRNQNGFTTQKWGEQKIEAFELGFKGAWKTKYHWGTFLQVLLLLTSIIIQVIE